MSRPDAPPPNDDDALPLPDDAATWFARLHSGEVIEADRTAFSAWCARDPDHVRQYRRLATLWQATLAVPTPRLRALMAPTPAEARPARRRQWLGWMAAGSVAGIAGVMVAPLTAEQAPGLISLTTAVGERRQTALPDGTVVHLNVGTSAEARFDARQRALVLHRGEVYLDVLREPGRPFVVDGGLGRVQVLGTRFNVRRDAQAMLVSVEEGTVRVAAGPWWRRHERELRAGEQVVVYADESLSGVAQVNVNEILAWQRGKLIFNDVPLATVVLEMNRYLEAPVRLGAAHLGELRVSGVLSVEDPEAMIAALPAIAPVVLLRLADGRIQITPR